MARRRGERICVTACCVGEESRDRRPFWGNAPPPARAAAAPTGLEASPNQPNIPHLPPALTAEVVSGGAATCLDARSLGCGMRADEFVGMGVSVMGVGVLGVGVGSGLRLVAMSLWSRPLYSLSGARLWRGSRCTLACR
jgi:hypothetical protein